MRKYINIVESFQRVSNEYFDGHVELLKNPSRSTFAKMKREEGAARGFLDVTTDTVTVWFGPVLHGDVEAEGQIWLTWDEPHEGELLATFDYEDLAYALDVDDDLDAPDIAAVIEGSRNLRPLQRGYRLVIESR